ncbi:MAG: DUF3299 domain-containing protein [Gammaproteobacteria bacterium]|nr:DUF3299 domain-containing protein [Gammaproteobacteria bacterium]MBU1556517.1 DUF3299 domain-containing protein [Gammaproteobacteria bacterium]MBU2071332.1 DUF3299 domain-containing protein [Gammaproteobacteria bacterium]MBU2182504.1 DUF3299 domain-containing protein [Gammaproteobacteria bacterium]MBU2204664.1 DUF3299 domain-containing protein [Gammaproteobacteria bacterium]
MLRLLSVALYLTLVASFTLAASEVKTIEWTDLMPEEDLKLLQQMPEVQHDYSQPSPFDDNYQGDDPAAQQWQQILSSAKVREEFNNTKVRVPGFIVPLEFDAEQNVTSFFLVPYFGACIHVPPPPPNQIIYMHGAKNLKADMIYSPFWISGTLKTETMTHDLGQAAYSMAVDSVEEYTY